MTPIEVVRVGSGRPELWLVAGVHGDEVEGMRVVEEALRTILPARGTLVGVPVAHPAALAAGTREGPDGADLNRTYPGSDGGGPTEQIADELWRLLAAARPDAVVTFHSWSHTGSATPYDEHALGDERGRALALALGLPFVEAWDWPVGLLGRELRTLGIPSAELELYGLGRHTDAGLGHGLHAAKAAAAFLGMLGPRTTLPTIEVQRRTLAATTTGRAVQLAELGSQVAEGTPVAEVRGLDGRTRETLTAPVDGWLAAHMTYGIVHPGDPVAVVFERR
jgi:hypothetical protein